MKKLMRIYKKIKIIEQKNQWKNKNKMNFSNLKWYENFLLNENDEKMIVFKWILKTKPNFEKSVRKSENCSKIPSWKFEFRKKSRKKRKVKNNEEK